MLVVKKEFWLFLLFLSLHCEGDLVPNLTLIINSKRNLIRCILTDDSLNTAIAWKLPRIQPVPPSEYLYESVRSDLDCDMNAEDVCVNRWINTNQWKLSSSLNDEDLRSWKPTLSLDYRWEKIPTIEIRDKHELDLKMFSGSFELQFSVQTDSNATMQFCAKNRGCVSYTVLAEDKVSGFPYDGSDWAHYFLTGSERDIKIIRDTKEYKIFEGSFLDKIHLTSLTIFGRSLSLWKLYRDSFMITYNGTEAQIGPELYLYPDQSFCLSFFVKMSPSCKMELKLVNSKNDVIDSIIYEDIDWEERRFFVAAERFENSDDYKYRLIFRGITDWSSPFWIIDDVRECDEKDVRSSNLFFREEDLHLYECYSLKHPEHHIRASSAQLIQHSDSRCSKLTFGTRCISCALVLESGRRSNRHCTGSRVCDFDESYKTKCTCTAGFRGPTCEEPCVVASYGFDCKETCGECQNTCNPIDGACDACKNEYTGSTCKIPRLPISKDPPKINVSHTYISVELENEEYEGAVAPAMYIFQYKRDNEAWQNSSEYDLNDLSGKDIVRLLPDTEYIVRALLRTENDPFEDHYVKSKRIRTTCAEATEEDVMVESQVNRVAITIMNSTEMCSSSNFYLDFKFQTIPFTGYNLELFSLVPNTEYDFAIKSLITNATLDMRFKTKQGAPKEIENLKHWPITPTSVSLSWDPPRETNGVIKHYKVFYKHERYLRCYYTVRSKASSGEFQTKNTTIILDGLIPYSEYVASVRAATVSNGVLRQIRFKTLPTDIPNSDEIPQLSSVQRYDTVIIYLTEANCRKRFGPLLYTLRLCCKEEWCTCETKDIMSTTRDITYAHFNIQRFSTYSLEVDVQRPNGKRIEGILGQIFETQISAPSAVRNLTVFYKTAEKIFLRWLPPQLPSGEIEEYLIEYDCESFDSDTTIKPGSCELWPEFLCFELVVDKSCLNTTLAIRVKAENKRFPKFYSPTSSILTTSGIEKPDPPRDFFASWDDHYNLTLTWTHSNTISPSVGFKIRVFGEADRYFKTNEEKLYTYKITNATMSTRLFITLSAENSAGESRMVSLVTYSPPKTPEFTADPYVIGTGNVSATVKIPELSQLSNESYLYVIVSEVSKVCNVSTKNFLTEIVEATVTEQHDLLWIAKEYLLGITSGNKRTLTIGLGEVKYSTRLKQNITNRILKPGKYYNVTFLLSNTFHAKTRFSVRRISISTVQGDEAKNEVV